MLNSIKALLLFDSISSYVSSMHLPLVDLGDDLRMHTWVNVGYHKTESYIITGIEIAEQNFLYEGDLKKGKAVYSKTERVGEIQDDNLYDGAFDESNAFCKGS
jgi:hypothetical protein